MTEVRAYVNARDDQVKFFFEVAEQCKRDTVTGGAITGEGLRAIFKTEFTHTQGAV